MDSNGKGFNSNWFSVQMVEFRFEFIQVEAYKILVGNNFFLTIYYLLKNCNYDRKYIIIGLIIRSIILTNIFNRLI